MVEDATYTKRTDFFQDNIFSQEAWTAPTLSSPQQIREQIDSFALCGRRIKSVRIIGYSYTHSSDCIENAIGKPKNLSTDKSQDPLSSRKPLFPRSTLIDEPFLIQFEDGDVFEIDTPQEPIFRMSMNHIPMGINAELRHANVDANILFSPCLGQRITAVEFDTYITDKEPMYGTAFDAPPYWREFVAAITFHLENGTCLQIGPSIDYCDIVCLDKKKQPMTLPFSELKPALYNWEDLHIDESTGFAANSPTLLFGAKGAICACVPYMTLSSSSKRDAFLCISVDNDDFLLLDWCISLFIGNWFDEYGEYHFTPREWYAILDKADHFLSREHFDDLFDEILAQQKQGDDMMCALNVKGALFWKNREKYQTQIQDLRLWSSLVLGFNDVMNIYGF